MRIYFILFLIVVCRSSLASAQGRVLPFEDYSKCYVGFIKDKKDTLWPAQFESAIPAMTVYRNQEYNGWIVKFQGYYGVIDREGKIAVPFLYDEIHATFDANSFIAVKNGKAGIISGSGEVKIPLNFQSIMLQNVNYDHFYYLVFDQDRKGMINDKMEWICQPIYQEIEMVERHGERYSDQQDEFYFLVHDSVHVGLINFQGKLLLPVQFDGISDLVFNDLCDKLTFFWQVYKNNKVGLYNAAFEELAAPVWQDVKMHSVIGDSCGAVVRHFATLRDGDKYLVTDLHSGKKSKFYDYAENAGAFHLVKSDKRYGVLDEQLNELPIRSKKEISLFSDGGLYASNIYNERETEVISFALDKEVIALKDPENRTKRGRYHPAQYGLYNYRTHEEVDPQYDLIFRKTMKGESYFWAYDFSQQDRESGELTIYNSKLELLHHYEFSNFSHGTIERFFYCSQKDERLLLLQNRNGYYGGINAKGEVVIPFEYTEFEPTRSDLHYSCKTTSWIVTKGTKKGIYSPEGKLLLPAEYDEINPHLNTFYQVRKGTEYGLIDSNFRMLIDGCTIMLVNNATGLEYSLIYHNEYHEVIGNQLYYAVKNDSLYVLQNMHFKKVTGPMISSKEDFSIVGNQILLRKDGTVINTGYRADKVTPTLFAVQRPDTLWLYDQKGNLLNKIGGVGYYNRQAEWLQLTGKKNLIGAADLVTGKVLLEPVWVAIIPFIRDNKQVKDLFWVQRPAQVQNENSTCYLINSLGEKVVDVAFDHPVQFDRSEIMVFRSGASFGLIKKDLQVLVPATYTQIRKIGTNYFLQKGMWYVYSPEKGIIDLNVYAIAIDPHPKGYLLFGYESMGILGRDLEWVVPLTPIATVKRQLDLVALLGITSFGTWHGVRNRFFVADSNARLFNNQFILELSEARSTRYTIEEKDFSLWRNNPYYSVHPNELKDLEITVQLWNTKYLSVTRRHNSSQWNYFIARRYDTDRWNTTMIEHATYLRSDTTFTKLELKDIFLEGSNYAQVIDELLTNYINKRQLFGVNCVNLIKILDDYKKNFYLTNDAIVFCQPNTDVNSIVLRYSDLKGMVRE